MLGVLEFHAGAEWDLFEVRDVREHDGVFVTNRKFLRKGLGGRLMLLFLCEELKWTTSFRHPERRWRKR